MQAFQRIDHFAASDAWSGNFVGQHWASPQKEQIARWLFGNGLDETGSPEGIGLSLWRVNLGAGTLEQDSADIVPFQRRAESFLTKDGKAFDWGKCAGQRYFMEQAVGHGCEGFLLFSNSPPVQYTKNGRGWAPEDGTANLTAAGYRLFAEYMAKVADHYVNAKGWNIRFISPVNEPQLDWITPRQEGSPWRNGEIARLVRELDRAMGDAGLASTRIIIPESDRLSRLYGADDGALETRFGPDAPQRQAAAFFDPGSPHYVGDLRHIAPIVAGHDYGSHKTNGLLEETRVAVRTATEARGIQFHQTEWCMLPNQPLPMDGFSADWAPDNHADIQVGLLLGRLVYSDFVHAGATAWGYWKGMEVHGNHALVSLFPNGGDLHNGGLARPNKLLWALGNYSHFIRPGYRRIAATGADDLDGLVASAYLAPDGGRIVAVLVNSSFEAIPVRFGLPADLADRVGGVSAYRTDGKMDLGNLAIHQTHDRSLLVAPRSLTTVVFPLDGPEDKIGNRD